MNRSKGLLVAFLATMLGIAAPMSGAHADGEPFDGFGTDGMIVDLGVSNGESVHVTDAIDLADGAMLVVGWLNVSNAPAGTQRGFVAMYDTDGHRDPTFGSGGVTFFPDGLGSQPESVVALQTGSIMVGGFLTGGLVRLSADGIIDPTFSWRYGGVQALVAEPSGGVIVFSGAGASSRLIARRIDSIGRLDPTYSGDLAGVVPDNNWSIAVNSASWSPDGRVIVAISTAGAGCGVVALMPNGVPDAGFGVGGVALPDGPADTAECSATPEPDGNILVRVTRLQSSSRVVIRLGSNGAVSNPAVLSGDNAGVGIAVEGHGRVLSVGGAQTAGAPVVWVRAFQQNGAPDVPFGLSSNEWRSGSVSSFANGVRSLLTGDILVFGSSLDGTGVFLALLSSPWGLAPQPPLIPTSKFVALTPSRILDTRIGLGAPAAKVPPNGQIDLQITGRGGVPTANVDAVVINVTATESNAAGFVSVFPAGRPRPFVSNLNMEAVGQTAANLVTVRVGGGGAVSLYAQGGAHLIADVAGYYERAGSSTSGRFVPLDEPNRVLDTRIGRGAPAAKVGAGGHIDVQVLPASAAALGVSAVALNLTATEASAAGYITVWPAGIARPMVSNLNVVTGDTRANLVIVPVNADGKVSIFTQSGAHLLADVAGWFTDEHAAEGSDGLFVPIAPARILDTRNLFEAPLPAEGSWVSNVGATPVVAPVYAAAAVVNLTATDTGGAGFVTLWPSDVEQPAVSNLNATRAAQIVPNAAIVRLGDDTISLFTQSGAHLIVDIAGWYTLA